MTIFGGGVSLKASGGSIALTYNTAASRWISISNSLPIERASAIYTYTTSLSNTSAVNPVDGLRPMTFNTPITPAFGITIPAVPISPYTADGLFTAPFTGIYTLTLEHQFYFLTTGGATPSFLLRVANPAVTNDITSVIFVSASTLYSSVSANRGNRTTTLRAFIRKGMNFWIAIEDPGSLTVWNLNSPVTDGASGSSTGLSIPPVLTIIGEAI
jgi:hypothetical protein